MLLSQRSELFGRLRYTFISSTYQEIDILLEGLVRKDNFEELCEEFFHGCRIDAKGNLIPSGFFSDENGSASLLYAMYELLGSSPETFLLKHRVTRVSFLKKNLSGCFRLPSGIFNLPRLEALTVRGIGISRLPDKMAQARGLKIVDLGGNRFQRFPEVLLKLSRLRALNLSYNGLDALPDGFSRLRHLRVVNLRGNKITVLPAGLQRLQELRVFDLTMNHLSSLPESLETILSLRELRVAYNNLTAADEASWELRVPFARSGSQGSLGIGG